MIRRTSSALLCSATRLDRGLIPVSVVSLMESLVDVLKAELVAAANSPDKATADRFQATEGNINDVNDFDVDLGDYFDVLSGDNRSSGLCCQQHDLDSPAH